MVLIRSWVYSFYTTNHHFSYTLKNRNLSTPHSKPNPLTKAMHFLLNTTLASIAEARVVNPRPVGLRLLRYTPYVP